MEDKQKDKPVSKLMGRRKFLTLSSVAMLTPISAHAGIGKLAPLANQPDLDTLPVSGSSQAANVSVGYWPGGQSSQASEVLTEVFVEEGKASVQQSPEQSPPQPSEQQAQPTLLEAKGMELLHEVQEGLSSRVVDAGTISPDSMLQGRDVRVTIHDVALAEAAGDRLAEWLLDTMYQVKTDGDVLEAPFHAWGYKDDQQTNVGAVSFTAPVEADGGLTFRSTRTVRRNDEMLLRLLNSALSGRGADREDCATATCALSVNNSVQGPKLREGDYLIGGPSYRTGKLPEWGEYEFRAVDGEDDDNARRLYRRTLTGLVAVDFDYVVVSVSAA